MTDRVTVTSLELRDGRLWSGERRVICHTADIPDLVREVEEHGRVDVVLGRPRGRPAADGARPARTKIAASVPADVSEALRRRAEAEGRTPSACIREAIEEWLSRP